MRILLITLKRGVGLSPAVDKVIHFCEFPDVQLSRSKLDDEHWQLMSSEWLLAEITFSTWTNIRSLIRLHTEYKSIICNKPYTNLKV